MEDSLDLRDIDQLVGLGGKFLRTASTKPDIMKLLMGLGHPDAEHAEGWALILSARIHGSCRHECTHSRQHY